LQREAAGAAGEAVVNDPAFEVDGVGGADLPANVAVDAGHHAGARGGEPDGVVVDVSVG
jgi:hypothetical protein